MPKYPNIEVQLTGQDGNAFYIIGTCLQAMRRAGVSPKPNVKHSKSKPPQAIIITSLPPAWNGLT